MSAPQALSLAWRWALDLVFPPRCVGCSSFGASICDTCLAGMPRAHRPRCSRCWMPGARSTCERCAARPLAFEEVRCPFVYEGAAREAVHALKYRGLSEVAGAMAEPMEECLSEWAPAVAAMIPVPLIGSRRRLRGYNQAELLARQLSRLSGVPLASGVLIRTKGGLSQARASDETSRRENVRDAFAVRRGLQGEQPLLLIDDVITSGATLDAAARALRSAGSGAVYALTFARED